MVLKLKQKQKTLYNQDYNLWILDTIQKLENREFDYVDWDNLIEEVSDLSRRDKRKLDSLLTKLFEHFLKLKYWESERERNIGHWRGEIMNFRKQIKRVLRDSPSLKTYLQEILNESYLDGRDIASQSSLLPLNVFPEKPIASLEQILDEKWLP